MGSKVLDSQAEILVRCLKPGRYYVLRRDYHPPRLLARWFGVVAWYYPGVYCSPWPWFWINEGPENLAVRSHVAKFRRLSYPREPSGTPAPGSRPGGALPLAEGADQRQSHRADMT
jgi:hypothetical protein